MPKKIPIILFQVMDSFKNSQPKTDSESEVRFKIKVAFPIETYERDYENKK